MDATVMETHGVARGAPADVTDRVRRPAAASAVDFAELSDMVLALYRGASSAEGWHEFLACLAARFAAEYAALILQSPGVGDLGIAHVYGASGVSQARAYDRSDPRRDAPLAMALASDDHLGLPDGVAACMSARSGADAASTPPIYRKTGVPHSLGMNVARGGRYLMKLRLTRRPSQPGFSARDCRMVEALAPHLRAATEIHLRFDEIRCERALYAEAMDRLELGIVVLDERFRILHANALAQTLLDERDALLRTGAALTARHRDEGKRLNEAITRAAAAHALGRPGPAQVMRLRRSGGRSDLCVIVRAAPPQLADDEWSHSAAVAVFITPHSGPETADPLRVEPLAALFGLTRKEASLALHIANGMTIKEAAAAMGVTLNTARAHLRSIYAKTGFDRQATLVRALLRHVPIAGR